MKKAHEQKITYNLEYWIVLNCEKQGNKMYVFFYLTKYN